MMMRKRTKRTTVDRVSRPWSDRERLWRWVDWLLALLLAGSAQYEVWIHSLAKEGVPGPHAVHAVFVLLVTVPLAWRRRAPLAVLCVVIGSAMLEGAAFANFPSFQPFLASIIAVYSVAAHSERRRALVGAAIVFAALIPGEFIRALTSDHSVDVGALLVFAGAWFVGRTLRRWRLEAAAQGQRASRLEREQEEQARLAVAEERARIARELHDVVAHAVSVIVIQSQGAQRELEGDQPSVREALGSIESTGRQALVEMRRLLGILRRSDDELALTPQPSLSHLDGLVEHVREAGLPVELRIEGEAAPLPPGVDVSAYRIVQEALTNTLKHAGPAHARVVVRYACDELELEISDDGRARGKGGVGHGLVGMGERVAVVGGVLESGRQPDGGFLVRARLPLDSAHA
jgi:signal transduction histidine kinase